MKRLTDSDGTYTMLNIQGNMCLGQWTFDNDLTHKLASLEDIEEKLGVDLAEFLNECIYVLKNSNESSGVTSDGKKITTDFGYVEDFIKSIKKAVKKREG